MDCIKRLIFSKKRAKKRKHNPARKVPETPTDFFFGEWPEVKVASHFSDVIMSKTPCCGRWPTSAAASWRCWPTMTSSLRPAAAEPASTCTPSSRPGNRASNTPETDFGGSRSSPGRRPPSPRSPSGWRFAGTSGHEGTENPEKKLSVLKQSGKKLSVLQ